MRGGPVSARRVPGAAGRVMLLLLGMRGGVGWWLCLVGRAFYFKGCGCLGPFVGWFGFGFLFWGGVVFPREFWWWWCCIKPSRGLR
ncbi:hypothetical protein BDW42DRAFT_181231 [Aspergillus taichungensis]|uniref:Uncharacterized protein n=1 Tax=Aspergillus taichungensis TaxID=482145 RepID=A0A2J5HEE8_9EURO|nr:hypothetical protein BDW42DRAFT_181231 [Aspergillus taichungensis]